MNNPSIPDPIAKREGPYQQPEICWNTGTFVCIPTTVIAYLPVPLLDLYVEAIRILEARVAGACDGDQCAREKRVLNKIHQELLQ